MENSLSKACSSIYVLLNASVSADMFFNPVMGRMVIYWTGRPTKNVIELFFLGLCLYFCTGERFNFRCDY